MRKRTRKQLSISIISLILCVVMLIGTTFAWFSDSVSTGLNQIQSGNLDVALEMKDEKGEWINAEGQLLEFVKASGDKETEILWEPGVRYNLPELRVVNNGNLALKYQILVTGINGDAELLDVITFKVGESTINEFCSQEGILSAKQASDGFVISGVWEPSANDNAYMNKTIEGISITVQATQASEEYDSFGNTYDEAATFPSNFFPIDISVDITDKVVNNQLIEPIEITGPYGVNVKIASGTTVTEGVTKVTLTITEKEVSESNVNIEENEEMKAFDVHIEGINENNTVPMVIEMGNVLPTGLNKGNLTLYHVEEGKPNLMEEVDAVDDFATHNQFVYDALTGGLTLYMATFSEVTVVANTENAWAGNVDTDWHNAENDEYTIANADEFAGFGSLVASGTDFSGKTVKLANDINMGGEDYQVNGKLQFYPIGYTSAGYGGAFRGIFDGQGHTISNIFQNTWMLDGNYDNGYYNAAMGVFGYVYDGTIKNLTVDNFRSEGEFAPTGVIAAYGGGSVCNFENIAITNCQPYTYNTSVAGIVGIDSSNDNTATTFNFKNITVDKTNTIGSLWGSWDVGAAGILGRLREDGSANFTNCNVAAKLDVYNDVCANYQYYWYRYCGMMIGTVDKTKTENGLTVLDLSNVKAQNCTVNFGDWNNYYYCEFEANSMASYSEDYQFSRVPDEKLNLDVTPVTCKHTHTAEEDKQAVNIPFTQVFGGKGWGVKGTDISELAGIEVLGIVEANQNMSEEKFVTKFVNSDTYLYRVGNENAVSIGTLFEAVEGKSINDSGVYVTIEPVEDDIVVSGSYTADTSEWEKGTLEFSGTGLVKIIIQDYDYCEPTELCVEVVDGTNLTSATGYTGSTNKTFVLLQDVNNSNYLNYWNCTLYGNGFTLSLSGAPTTYKSSQGHGVVMVKNATIDNLVIKGDVYNSYGAYTSQDCYNAAVDIIGETVIQNCFISNCAAPVNARADVTIKNTTLYGGTVANLLIKSGTVTLEDVTTANYADGRTLVGMGIVAHSDVTETAKLVLNGTLKQYNFINETNTPSDSNAKMLYNAMFDDSCGQYHFGTSPNREVNTGIISMSTFFDASDITDNANTGYVGSKVEVNSVNGYVYTQPNTVGSVDNSYSDEDYAPTGQGAIAPTINFDHTINDVAKTDGSNDYCYEESGNVYISMDTVDSFDWNTSILTATKLGNVLDYTVTINGSNYTGKSITFDTAGDYKVIYTYTDPYNYRFNAAGERETYEMTYTKIIPIKVSVIEESTKHAEFAFGSSGTDARSVTIGNNTYVMPDVTDTSDTVGSITVNGTTVYYPLVEAYTSDGNTKHGSTSNWYMCYPVFKDVLSITDYENNGTGNAVVYGTSTTTMPVGLSLTAYTQYFETTTAPSGAVSFTTGGADTAFKYQASTSADSEPTTLNNVLIYKSPTLSNNARKELYLLVQYQYQDNAGATYYYYVGYHMPETTESSCISAGTLITLSDGTQKTVEEITLEDSLLVYDHYKGEYVASNIIFIENDGEKEYNVINLEFSNGTTTRLIYEHAYFDLDLNRYVYITEANYDEYIGHRFAVTDGDDIAETTLVNSYLTTEVTGCYSLVTEYHYNFFVDGLFSIPGGIDGLFNIFEYGEDLAFDSEKMQEDIDTYGLFTYEDFADYVTEDIYKVFNAKYFKVAMGKGMLTEEELLSLINQYSVYFVEENDTEETSWKDAVSEVFENVVNFFGNLVN